jgi:hypothetical protein
VVDLPNSRRAIVLAAGSEGGCIERPHLLATLCRKRNMQRLLRARMRPKPKLRLAAAPTGPDDRESD